jgi:hypothetical protein
MVPDTIKKWHALFPDKRSMGRSIDLIKRSTHCDASVERGKKDQREKRIVFEIQTTWQRVEDMMHTHGKLLGGARLDIMPWSSDEPFWTDVEAICPDGMDFADCRRRIDLMLNDFYKNMKKPEIRELSRDRAYGFLEMTIPGHLIVPGHLIAAVEKVRASIEKLDIELFEVHTTSDTPTIIPSRDHPAVRAPDTGIAGSPASVSTNSSAKQSGDPRPLVIDAAGNVIDRGTMLDWTTIRS